MDAETEVSSVVALGTMMPHRKFTPVVPGLMPFLLKPTARCPTFWAVNSRFADSKKNPATGATRRVVRAAVECIEATVLKSSCAQGKIDCPLGVDTAASLRTPTAGL